MKTRRKQRHQQNVNTLASPYGFTPPNYPNLPRDFFVSNVQPTQLFNQRGMPVLCGVGGGGVASVVSHADKGRLFTRATPPTTPPTQQQLHNLPVPRSRRVVQGRRCLRIGHRGIGVAPQQQADGLHVLKPRGRNQQRVALVVPGDVDAVPAAVGDDIPRVSSDAAPPRAGRHFQEEAARIGFKV